MAGSLERGFRDLGHARLEQREGKIIVESD